ncbi:MAG: dTDP-4-dehydrorhamnose reductase [Heliobacteriaceae bacterium]|nr:dTDP-4-dehydrorhamnose reductase [Heliobacteriaceae bacterium]
MKVLVTGADGMLGQDLCPVLEDEGYFVVETNKSSLDVTDFNAVERVLSREKPDLVIHCAAYTDVDGAEADLKTAETVNAAGTENAAKVCAKLGAVMVYISTDYVFDGEKTEPYTPEDTPNPLNNYGLTKLKGEEAVKKYCEKYYIVRTSWLYGHYGKNFVETMLSYDGDVIRVVDDQTGCPTWTVELANGILKILDKPYGIYHICGSGQTSRYGFAKEIGVNALPCSTEDFPRPAKRPKYSVMDNGGTCQNWKSALKDYLALII